MPNKQETLVKLEKCVKKRERLFVRLQLCHDLIKDLADKSKRKVFLSRCSELSGLYSDFESVAEEIDELNATLDKAEDKIDTSAPSQQFDIMFYNIKTMYDSLMESTKPTLPSVSSDLIPKVQPKLPQIDIPKFTGQLEQFSSFKALYDNLIHNSSIAPIEKFSYLKSLLAGPALSVLEAIPFDPDQYDLAYQTLVDRYTNPRILASFYLNKILDQPPVKSPNLSGFRQLVDVFHINTEALKSLKVTDLSGFVFLQLALRLLDSSTRKSFEQEYKTVTFPELKHLIDFLRSQCAILELTKDNKPSYPPSKPMSSPIKKAFLGTQPNCSKPQTPVKPPDRQAPSSSCPLCNDEHKLHFCPQFIGMTVSQRHDKVQSLKRCFGCLGSHMISKCGSSSSCRHCKSKRHHSLLHQHSAADRKTNLTPNNQQLETTREPASENPAIDNQSLQTTLSCSLNPNNEQHTALLGTAVVLVQDSLGNWQTCRAVIDGGSQVNFITGSLAQVLRLPSRKTSIGITGIGHSATVSTKGVVSCKISSLNQQSFLRLDAVVISKISSDLPAVSLSENLRKKFSSLVLADPNFHRPGKIDMLLGAQVFTEILTDGLSLIKGHPTALHTIFGWVLMGDVITEQTVSKQKSSFFVTSPSDSTDQLLQKFWETEEIFCPKPLSPEDQACENHFKSTISRDETGRYIASLPFKDGKPPELGSNREAALRKLHFLEKKFQRKSNFKELYTNNIKDYLDRDHLKLASEPTSYLLTHHGVLKDSSSSPLRVVFNASELSDTNNSLNKSLLTGPKLQSDIGSIITNFRLHPIALTCDIQQMYRAIRLSPSDCKYQHIFWRPNSCSEIQEYELQRLTFGVSSSPYIAQRTLKQLIEDEGQNHPKAALVLDSACYIDDLVFGASTEKEAVMLHNDITQLLRSGGFELHKWTSSSSNVLKAISNPSDQSPHHLGSPDNVKLLGLQWNPSLDVFTYSITPMEKTPTKRNVLSQVARIYDVNGYISPVVFTFKHLLQQIWIEQLDWDDPLSTELQKKWNRILCEIPLLEHLQIPRYILSSYLTLQLIGFSDASQIGMCAALYLRVVPQNSSPTSKLVQAKTKVSPLKPLTIPRLELCAALLLSRLIDTNKFLIENLKIPEILLFTDSMNVLAWLRTAPHVLETFVSNRVCKIIEKTPSHMWRHISGDQNPADCGSRGLLPSQILDNSLWWHGPSFLETPQTLWPTFHFEPPQELSEIKCSLNTAVASTNSENYFYNFINKYSSLSKLQNVMARILRFISNTRLSKIERKTGPLSVTERQQSMKVCIKLTQHVYYLQDIQALKLGKPCSKSLKTLSPFLQDGFLRVGGRLKFAPLPESSKHPYLIPSKSHLALLLCDYYHLNTLHGGPQLVQSLVQRRYWIPGIRNLLRKRIFQCLPCYKLKAKPLQPYMANLPPSRFQQGRCFENVGLDFAGPYLVKESPRRNARLTKCYVALFVCMSVKAIHLELVGSLTTESCIAAIDRFIARRGVPRNIYSDQGTNFIGSARYLKEIAEVLQDSNSKIFSHLARQEITWNFNPPHAPNFGGLWEAGVKSTKHHLKRTLENHNFTAEEFTTFLCRIESILNSRPICPVSCTPDDGYDYLTPGHFLVGGPLTSRPEEDISQEPLTHQTRWKRITHASQLFWKRWSTQYLHTLMQRPKWTSKVPNLKEGDLILMFSNNISPFNWPLGRIVRVFPDRDGCVRVVEVRTPNGTFTRPVNKLVALPHV